MREVWRSKNEDYTSPSPEELAIVRRILTIAREPQLTRRLRRELAGLLAELRSWTPERRRKADWGI